LSQPLKKSLLWLIIAHNGEVNIINQKGAWAMDWLKNFIQGNPFLSLFVPTTLGAVNFFANLMVALSDGQIDSNEMHQLMSSASGLETIFLVIIMLALKNRDKDKSDKDKRKK
jgi:hypothetical protein